MNKARWDYFGQFIGMTFIANGGDYIGQRVTIDGPMYVNPDTGDVDVWAFITPDGERWSLPHWRLLEILADRGIEVRYE